jgi:2-methylcitrate dehydratase PrpD
MSLTADLFELIEAKPVTEGDLRAAALFVLDAVANAAAGCRTDPGRILLTWAEQAAGQDEGREAFLRGALTHILETDDLHRASVVHPGCVVVPAVMAMARRSKASGRDCLIAVLKGFEATCRVGMAVGPAHYKVWHNTATCGPYGSAMAAAALLDLDGKATVDALGNAGTQSAGLWQFLDTGAMSKHLHAGRAAEAGVVAAQLAALGFSGPPAILEGDKGFFKAACPDADPGAVLRDPDAPWQLHLTSIKPWPSCRHTHPAIDAALELHPRIDGTSIASVEVETYQAAVDICDRPAPTSEYEAKFSLQHCVAAALARGAVGFESFGENEREHLRDLCGRISLRVQDPYASAYPDAWGSAVRITLSDNSSHIARRTHCKGDPEAALSHDEMVSKAESLLAYGGHKDPQGLIEAALALPADEAPSPLLV